MAERSTSSRWSILFVGAAILGATAVAATAQAKDAGDPTQPGLSISVTAKQFVTDGEEVFARGPAVARYVGTDGTERKVRKRVRLAVETTTQCRILKLRLAPLYLNLLGLQARTSHITLRLTGDSERTLGKLFCKLTHGIELDDSAVKERTSRSLTRQFNERPLPVFSMRVPIHDGASTSQIPPVPEGSCEVLNLFLGPLDLDLLGLIVELHGSTREDPVEVLVTADPKAGQLGKLLCELLVPPPPA